VARVPEPARHPLPAEEFDRIFGRVPRLTVEVVLTGPAGVALVRREIEPCRGQWHLPGGTVRFAEPLPDAVRRVALDELGVRVEVGPLLGYIEFPKMHADGYAGWPVGLAFRATTADTRFAGSEQGREIGFFRAVPPNTIAEQAEFLDRYLAG
jgi:ADP-ribose pyrophosphatase YjhB (NUDIX family)